MNVLEKVGRLERLLAKVRENGVRRPGLSSSDVEVQLVVRDEVLSDRRRARPGPPLSRAGDTTERRARFIQEDRWEPPAKVPDRVVPHVATLPPPYGMPRPALAAGPASSPSADDAFALSVVSDDDLFEVPKPALLPSDAWVESLPPLSPIEPVDDLLERESPLAADPEEFGTHMTGLERAVLRVALEPHRTGIHGSAFWEHAASELARRPSSIPPALRSSWPAAPMQSDVAPSSPVAAPSSRPPLGWSDPPPMSDPPPFALLTKVHRDERFDGTRTEVLDSVPPSYSAPPSAPTSAPTSEVPPRSDVPPSLDRARRRRSFRTIPPRRRLVKPPSMVVKIHGGLAALGVIGALAVVWVVLRSPESTGAPEPAGQVRAAIAPGAAESAPRVEVTDPQAAVPSATAAVLVAPPVVPAPRASAPPDGSALDDETAHLWISVDGPRWVFINGRKIGAAGTWLTVPCGWRHVRLAELRPPPPGESFPQWTNEGHSVLIPCAEATEIALSEATATAGD